MDQTTRNQLQRATQDARRLLEAEFAAQLEGTYDILPDGRILPQPGRHLDDRQRLARRKIVEAIEHIRAKESGKTQTQAVDDYTREAAFTALNRFVALKMLEARGLVQQCVSKGDQSGGFKEFTGLAPGLADLPDKGYQLYLECLFDELGTEVKVLFDRREPASLLWPRRQTVLDLIEILNRSELESVWDQDETIGWVYQYFNGQEERRAMRDASAAPRNSRELAVRNQFFTPRYVVQFLTDNTLGRIWYEMQQGATVLKEQCLYLVRRPSEVFLSEGAKAPETLEIREGLSQQELLKQPVYIPFRQKKDPRHIKVLDPACGSGHFLLYCFDLLILIYLESWEDEASPSSEVTGKSLREDYPTLDALHLAIPGLILRHNLHGIDIDHRCAQIAALALWMRGQKTFNDFRIAREIRPTIQRTNIAVAEPMPGEQVLLEEFISEQLSETPEDKLLGQLVRSVFKSMKLAGEAGSLLKIEEEIAGVVAEAKKQWKARPRFFQPDLFGNAAPVKQQEEFRFHVIGITDEQFWNELEQLIYDALRSYAEHAQGGGGYQRSLFADDAARGFAFIDLCRKRHDVVLMNPPFGELSKGSKDYLFGAYPNTKNDLFACFTERWLRASAAGMRLGAITSRSGFFFTTFQDWRKEVLLKRARPVILADLGYDVLDSAMVETAAYVVEGSEHTKQLFCFSLLEEEDKGGRLLELASKVLDGKPDSVLHLVEPSDFRRIPGAPFAYWVGERVIKLFDKFPQFAGHGRKASGGIGTTDDARFIRCWWEVLPNAFATSKTRALQTEAFVPIALGGQTSRFYASTPSVVKFGRNGLELKTFIEEKLGSASRNVRGQEFYFQPGLTWPLRGELFSAWPVPAGCVFSVAGKIATTETEAELPYLLGLFNSLPFDFLIGLSAGKVGRIRIQHQSGLIDRVPYKELDEQGHRLGLLAKQAWSIKRRFDTTEARSHAFTLPSLVQVPPQKLSRTAALLTARYEDGEREIARIQEEIDEIALCLYGLSKSDVRRDTGIPFKEELSGGDEPEDTESPESTPGTNDISLEVSALLDYLAGATLGRWDIRLATGEKSAPDLLDPFAPLPVCPPGQLQNEQGLPITKEEQGTLRAGGRWKYPIEIPWDGILVDDPGHPLDLEARVQEVLQVIWKDGWESVEREACEILGVPSLRDYFHKSTGFFAAHLKRYSKSRRQAPIYWSLSSSGGGYTIWLYYHRFRRDTLFQALNDFAKPKLQHERSKLDRLRAEAGHLPTKSQREAIESQASQVSELEGFNEELARVAPLWNPDLNDGVLINFAPLWRMIGHTPWRKTVKECWDALCSGDFDWAHLAMHLWPERVVPQCAKDASLAIAHGLENVFWEKDHRDRFVKKSPPECGWQPVIDRLVAERSNMAMESALESLLNAPPLVGTAGGGRRGSRATSAPRRPRMENRALTPEALASPSRSGSSAPAIDEETLVAVRKAIAAVPDGARKAEVLATTGLNDAVWNAAINALLERNAVVRTGERRGTRYHLAQEDGQSSPSSASTPAMEGIN